MPSCTTPGFPSLTSYAAARAHFDSVKPWRSKYNPDDERPIGIRAVKADNGWRFNKAMRMCDDDSIAFRLFATDCVIWHPDDTLTVQGYPSMSTNAFVEALTPAGFRLTHRIHKHNGRICDRSDPALHLMPTRTILTCSDYRYPDVLDSSYTVPDWQRGMVVNCEWPVRLHYSAEHQHWVPLETERLAPFYVPAVDRKLARQASREYHLATLEQVMNAVTALADIPPPAQPWAPGSIAYSHILDHLRKEEYIQAIAYMPRGTTHSFGKTHGTPRGIQPGFLTGLRNYIYNHEGVVKRVPQPILTPAQYQRYVADSNRFDA